MIPNRAFLFTAFIRSFHSVWGMSVHKNVVVVGGGIQGTSVAYFLDKHPEIEQVTLLEAVKPASAASGKGGGFMARSWGDGSPTQGLHELAFDMYEDLSNEIGCTSYRKLPVLSVSPGKGGLQQAKKNSQLSDILPSWLDGNIGRVGAMGWGDDTAQVTPREFVEKLIENSGIDVVLGTCCGVITNSDMSVTGVQYQSQESDAVKEISADAVVVSAGPWSSSAEDWFDGAVSLPMEGIKSTSIVWKSKGDNIDATALFCGEDNRFGTHLEVYPRPDGTIYLCGIGGSDYISKDDLKDGAFRQDCNANEARVEAAMQSFQEMSDAYKNSGELERSQACMRPCPPDAMPYMGKIPGYKGAYINAGHNCWGIAWAPACGKAMSELVADGESKCIDLTPFNPGRYTPNQRGSRGRKKKDASVGEQW